MASAGRVPGGFLDNAYRLLMRRNSVYVTFILAGAVVGERAVDYSINKVWEINNVGLFFPPFLVNPISFRMYPGNSHFGICIHQLVY
ncbi:hypothetical protein AXG93_1593s1060 [Marchantia polymorpha subsp. ruderalis]|uniref:Complex III subunit 9 n=1 Tax=Marchantia polymorpha subsp. ruderalis TaxID=1480154 RepID=A0A176WLV4_MARPO|nr:hypothetical protein AXG93_1593s1060 [Marchantia polymorpha subsp. ruderalis]